MEIQGKVALVTGGASGIGRASAQRLAREGASVVIADIDEAGGRETVAQIEAAGGRAAFVRADVTVEADALAMVAFAEETYGGLDILHNNAGIFTAQPRYPDAEPERWSRVLDTNLRGVILGTQHGIEALRRRGGGAIVQTASLAGIIGFATDPVYAATKGGVVMFTLSLAPLKEACNIRVNCVCPGIVETPMLRPTREASAEEAGPLAALLRNLPLIQPEEVADAVIELVRDESLAGRALMVRNGMPREMVPLPEMVRFVQAPATRP